MLEKNVAEKYTFVSVTKEHDDGRVRNMAKEIMNLVARDFEAMKLSEEYFSVYLRESDLKNDILPTWSASMTMHPTAEPEVTIADDQNRRPIANASRLCYKATCTPDHSQDYSGCFEVYVVTYNENPDGDSLVSAIIALAHKHYKEQVVLFYPEWKTEYDDPVHGIRLDLGSYATSDKNA